MWSSSGQLPCGLLLPVVYVLWFCGFLWFQNTTLTVCSLSVDLADQRVNNLWSNTKDGYVVSMNIWRCETVSMQLYRPLRGLAHYDKFIFCLQRPHLPTTRVSTHEPMAVMQGVASSTRAIGSEAEKIMLYETVWDVWNILEIKNSHFFILWAQQTQR